MKKLVGPKERRVWIAIHKLGNGDSACVQSSLVLQSSIMAKKVVAESLTDVI
jgi:hypothetical protein